MLAQTKVLMWLLLALLVYAFTVFSPQNHGLDSVELKGEFLDGKFPRLPNVSWQLVDAFPNFQQSINERITNFIEIPGTNNILALGKTGLVWMFNNDETNGEAKLVLDIRNKVMGSSDAGLLGVAFHPDFNDTSSIHRREIFFFYTYRFREKEPLYNRLTKFKFSQNLDSIISSSEEILIQQYDRNWWHNGGDMFFGKEGYLYVSLGDEGGSYDVYKNSQKINASLFAGIIRIDVDLDSSRSHPIRRYPVPPQGKPEDYPDNINQHYMIPNDNPWVSEAGDNLEEFFAIGLRSPHRMHYDTLTENIWVADVGQGSKEEISIIPKGGNAQWPYQEGNTTYPEKKPASIIGIETPPIFDYDRSSGGCIIGGFVYRGDKYPNLNVKYIFGDYVSKNIWALDTDNNKATLLCKATNTDSGIVSFLNSSDGYIYIVTIWGKILKLTEIVPQETPSLLSQTGAFTDLENMIPASGIIPYDVNTPLWSDGASKQRWISVPEESDGITFSQDSTWSFPVGTVFIKHFELPVSKDSTVKLETRFFVIAENKRGYGITYKWNQEGTDAELIADGELLSEEISLLEDEVISSQTWEYPSRTQCMDCHNSNAGYVLGVKTAQLNRSLLYKETGKEDNQIRTWNHLGLFSEYLANIDTFNLPKLFSINDTSATLQSRVRSYLDANCSYCHNPKGVDAAFDARSSTPLGLQHLVNEDVISRNSTVNNKVVKPYSLDSSELWLRDKSLGTDKMPPLGKNTLDEDYLKVLEKWILNLQYLVDEKVVVCSGDSYTFPDGEIFTNIEAPISYKRQLTSTDGIDSIITTHVVVNNHCQEYLVSAHICSGDPYIFGSDSLTSAGEYTKVFTSSDGFDSTVVLNLAVEQIDTTLTVVGATLRVNQGEATYQWIDADTEEQIDGETNQIYVPCRSGNYRAQITVNGCSTLSEARNFEIETITGIEEGGLNSSIRIFPNPAEDYMTVCFGDSLINGTVTVTNLEGKFVLQKAFHSQNEIDLQLESLQSGTYILHIIDSSETAVIKFVKR